jgi:hypothetical protein
MFKITCVQGACRTKSVCMTLLLFSFLGDGVHDCLVTENLCASRYFQVTTDQ